MAVVLTFIGAIFLALKITYNARDVRLGTSNSDLLSPNVALGGSFVAASLYVWVLLIILLGFGVVEFPHSSVFWVSLSITVLINIFVEVWRFRSYQNADLSLVAPFAGLAPMLTIITSWLILGELPTLLGAAGIGIIAFSLYLLYLKGPFTIKNFVTPFRTVWKNTGTRFGFLSSIPPALSIVFDKKAVAAADPVSFSAVAFLAIGLSALALDFCQEKEKRFVSQVTIKHVKGFFKVGFLHFFSIITFNSALLFDVVPHVSALRRISIVFEVIFAYLILDQKNDIKRRLMASLGVVAGIIFIAVGK